MRRLPILAIAVVACATVPAGDEPYVALGTEPFWSVGIGAGRMTYDSPEGRFSVPAPAPVVTEHGRRYETERLTVDIRPGICSDGMSDNLYADTVTVVADGLTLNGCGGGTVPEDSLAHSRWSIMSIDALAVDGDDYFLAFDQDRLSGRAGCNGFSGSWSRSGDTLTVGPLTATRMACPGARMEHERRAFAVLRGTARIEHHGGGIVVIAGNGGTIELRRSY